MTPLTFSIWQLFFAVCVMFHHSNVEIPLKWERLINRILVTPRMHGVHHSTVPTETNSNWSSGLTAWDWLHRTIRLNIPQQEIAIGVPAFRDPGAVVLSKMLVLPFEAQPDYWCFPDGQRPGPHIERVDRNEMLR
jgi:sterol desaturase/sphingolipid hydroxylase (fatty acid hydroxylase superfamily)